MVAKASVMVAMAMVANEYHFEPPVHPQIIKPSRCLIILTFMCQVMMTRHINIPYMVTNLSLCRGYQLILCIIIEEWSDGLIHC